MDPAALKLRRLTERALRDRGVLPLALLLEVLAPVRQMRELAQKFALAPKGFRVERAPATALAPLLAALTQPAQLEEVVALLALRGVAGPALPPAGAADDDDDADEADDAAAAPPKVDLVATVRLREQEIAKLRDELERAREGAVRAQERETQLRQTGQRDAAALQRLHGELERGRRPAAEPAAGEVGDRDLLRRVHELEQEVLARDEAADAARRQQAADHTRMRDLEEEVAELEALLPKGRRRKAVAEPPPPPPGRFLLPYFLPSFYRSLDGKDRRAVERTMHAILLFCTEGHAYPGLDVKQLGGQDLWSLRASLGLRVYFRHRDDGDVEFLELADREEQNTTLRRLKER